AEGPELVRAFWKALGEITVLDPACGSGAFLFAALNILEDLYDACLDRMQDFVSDLDLSGGHKTGKLKDFKETLDRIAGHPNEKYFVYKPIIIQNLFGVDIMEEATEICKLRLFLKLAAQLESPDKIEPLPDIDFNIKAGNSLIGFTSSEEAQKIIGSKLDFDNTLEKIQTKAEDLDAAFIAFRKQQTELGGEVTPEDKENLKSRLYDLEEELNIYLAEEYGVNTENSASYNRWKASHKPFHWWIEFEHSSS
ncbi:MAG: DNA methyltransferase, partial [Nitrospinales bacterium]